MNTLPFELDAKSLRVHLLDMGHRMYGDSILCQYRDTSILIDGGHSGDYYPSDSARSIPQQLSELLGGGPPFRVDLLVVTHCHSDHIGCLPRLVERGELQADWALVADERLGFGHPLDDPDGPIDAGAEPGAAALMAALREDTRAGLDDDELLEFLIDAAWLETNYVDMLQRLEEAGTNVVRYGRDDATQLVAAFSDIGLRLLGPTLDHLLICADVVRQHTESDADALLSMPPDALGEEQALATYRQLADSPVDALDMPGKGAALNDQSIVLMLEAEGRKVLLPGDMQFAAAEVAGLDAHMTALRAIVAAEAPFDFVKVSHHSSYNGLGADHYDELAGTRRFGHTGGTGSRHHPSSSVLSFLRQHRQDIKFCRTDRNGLITVRLSTGGVWIFKEKGSLNDFSSNASDIAVPAEEAAAATPSATTAVTREPAGAGSREVVEVTTRIPHAPTRVSVSIDVQPGTSGAGSTVVTESLSRPAGPGPAGTGPARTSTGTDEFPALRIAAGRRIPRLAVVTSRTALARNIGGPAADHALAAVRDAGHLVIDDLPPALVASGVTGSVRERLSAAQSSNSPVLGVVLLGGYDVVPAQRLDVLDASLRNAPGTSYDPDKFIVWSDDVYGDTDGDALPELPVSRIPDGESADLVFAALQAGGGNGDTSRFGVRNKARPFAELVFDGLPGRQPLYVSEPITAWDIPAGSTLTDVAYFMLHGSPYDGTAFWGESGEGHPDPEAVSLDTVPDVFHGVVLTGCCWGALCVQRPAVRVDPGQRVVGRAPNDSIALKYLKSGATAFVGCTGAHYSPLEEPYDYFGRPMHTHFWERYLSGTPPARALHEAKIAYLAGVPHRTSQPAHVAIELKILRQFTCLGLGW